MARKSLKLQVRYHDRAVRTLQQLWKWNAERYSSDHADQYVGFLKSKADLLGSNYPSGRCVPTRPEFQFDTFRLRTGSHGHVVIYRVHQDFVQVMDFFHRAQDWTKYVESLDEQ
jgi:plasmid stabilization system protein ParE